MSALSRISVECVGPSGPVVIGVRSVGLAEEIIVVLSLEETRSLLWRLSEVAAGHTANEADPLAEGWRDYR